jgi:hypothetical protein
MGAGDDVAGRATSDDHFPARDGYRPTLIEMCRNTTRRFGVVSALDITARGETQTARPNANQVTVTVFE